MLKSNFSAAAIDPDSESGIACVASGAAEKTRHGVHLLICLVVPFESALERICLDFVNIIILV